MTYSVENDVACDPPCSLACLVTEGVHHTAESLREAALAEIEEAISHPPSGANEQNDTIGPTT